MIKNFRLLSSLLIAVSCMSAALAQEPEVLYKQGKMEPVAVKLVKGTSASDLPEIVYKDMFLGSELIKTPANECFKVETSLSLTEVDQIKSSLGTLQRPRLLKTTSKQTCPV